jgi:hypothetical protein
MGEQLERAGFETAFSSIAWVYTTGLPKSANISKLLSRRADAEREANDKVLKVLKSILLIL